MKAARAWMAFSLATSGAGVIAAAAAGFPVPMPVLVGALVALAGVAGLSIARARTVDDEPVLPSALEVSTLVFPPTSPAERRRRR